MAAHTSSAFGGVNNIAFGPNNSFLQQGLEIYECIPNGVAGVSAGFADNDTFVVTLANDDRIGIPPRNVQLWTTTISGSGIISSNTGTFNLGTSLSLNFTISDPNQAAAISVAHTISGHANAAAVTATEICTSLNADTTFNPYAIAAHDVFVLNDVVVMAQDPLGSIDSVSGNAASIIGLAGTADNAVRTFYSVTPIVAGGIGWSHSYNASARQLTVTNELGAAFLGTVIVLIAR